MITLEIATRITVMPLRCGVAELGVGLHEAQDAKDEGRDRVHGALVRSPSSFPYPS